MVSYFLVTSIVLGRLYEHNEYLKLYHKTKNYLLERFINSMYNGSATSLVMQLLGNKKTSKKELDAIRELLKKLDK